MDEYLAGEREVNRKAAALHYVGPEVGVGATIWARAVQDVLALHESARARFAANTAGLEDWERFHGTAFMLVVAVEQILGFERTVRRLTGDAELAKARARFDYVCPDAEGLRDLVAHLDDYAVGKSRARFGRYGCGPGSCGLAEGQQRGRLLRGFRASAGHPAGEVTLVDLPDPLRSRSVH
jgi:hypothetical protein